MLTEASLFIIDYLIVFGSFRPLVTPENQKEIVLGVQRVFLYCFYQKNLKSLKIRFFSFFVLIRSPKIHSALSLQPPAPSLDISIGLLSNVN